MAAGDAGPRKCTVRNARGGQERWHAFCRLVNEIAHRCGPSIGETFDASLITSWHADAGLCVCAQVHPLPILSSIAETAECICKKRRASVIRTPWSAVLWAAPSRAGPR